MITAMASHMSDLGFTADDRDAFAALMMRAAEEGEAFASPGGTYVRWSPGEGIELWAQVLGSGKVVGLNPHFAGESDVPIGGELALEEDEQYPLDGSLRGWAEPDGDQGICPLMCDLPDFGVVKARPLPAIAGVQIAAFAHRLETWSDEAAFTAAGTKFAPESLIPTFSWGGPRSIVMLTGRVLRARRIANPTGVEFQWALVKSLGGTFDVVADLALLGGGEIREGSIVQGDFWLSGRFEP